MSGLLPTCPDITIVLVGGASKAATGELDTHWHRLLLAGAKMAVESTAPDTTVFYPCCSSSMQDLLAGSMVILSG